MMSTASLLIGAASLTNGPHRRSCKWCRKCADPFGGPLEESKFCSSRGRDAESSAGMMFPVTS
jgi:hypothetical protein